jgi:tRNA(Ile)-lysidine synthase
MAERGPAPELATARCLENVIDPSRPLLLAVSGGSDSMGMLLAFHRTVTGAHPGILISAATVDHRLRPEAADEAAAVAAFCAGLGIDHRILPWIGEKPSSGIQAAARLARYSLLADEAGRIGAGAVLTAHTLDDQFETVQMRADRQSETGAFGAAGMAPQMLFGKKTWVVRPFLNCRRADLRHYLKAQDVDWIDDPSNADPRYERVRQRSKTSLDTSDEWEFLRRTETAATMRGDRAELVAAAIDAHASQWRCALFVMRDDGTLSQSLFAEAVAELIALAGGLVYPIAGPKMVKLRTFLDEAKPGSRLALGRCIVMRRAGNVLIWREDRGFADLLVEPRSAAIWDERFRVENPTDRPVLITRMAAMTDSEDLDVPDAATPSIAAAACSALPRALSASLEPGESRGDWPGIQPIPVIARYDTFLPVFERTIGVALTRLLGLKPYPAPPLATVNLDRMMRQ